MLESGHAFLIAGNTELLPSLLGVLEKEGVQVRGNADSYVRTYTSFGIEEARELCERAQARGLSDRRVFVLATPSITGEAQNALLKTFEEPPAGAIFFLVIPSPDTLLPTLRSRMQRLEIDAGGLGTQTNSLVSANKFISAPPAVRIDMLKPLLEKGDDDKRDLAAILAFLSGLEHALEKKPESLRAVYRARKYVLDRGALVKPLLEQLAILV